MGEELTQTILSKRERGRPSIQTQPESNNEPLKQGKRYVNPYTEIVENLWKLLIDGILEGFPSTKLPNNRAVMQRYTI